MGKSNVTDSVIDYMEKNGISAEETADVIGIPVEKLKKDYREALLAEEFLELCVYLNIRPEDILNLLKSRETNGKEEKNE